MGSRATAIQLGTCWQRSPLDDLARFGAYDPTTPRASLDETKGKNEEYR